MWTRPCYPLLLSLYPALFLFAHNRAQLDLVELMRPLVLSLFGGALLWTILFAFQRDARRSALTTAVFVLLFFAFGALRETTDRLLPVNPIGDTAVVLLWSALCAGICLLVLAKIRTPAGRALLSGLTTALNFVALVLLLFPIASIVRAGGGRPIPTMLPPVPLAAGTTPPDIYYIVLDGYGSSPLLRRLYGFDNRAFLAELEDLGFYVAKSSRANYPRTMQALSSTLNFSYLDPANPDGLSKRQGEILLVRFLKRSRLFSSLERLGYETYAFETGYAATELRESTHFLSREQSLSELETLLLSRTPLSALRGASPTLDAHELHRRRILSTLELLPEVAARKGPKLVFAHLLAPHPPFVFNADGSATKRPRSFDFKDGNHFLQHESRQAYIRGYAGQVAFLTGVVGEAIAGILAASATPPIIVLQGDHGPGLFFHHESSEKTNHVERMMILNAYYLPAPRPTPGPYPDISPVNSFRMILAHYLGAQLPPLQDHSYYVPYSSPFAFEEITDRLGVGRPAKPTDAGARH